MAWDCPQIEERLSDWLEGRLSPEDARDFSAHLSACAQCQQLVDGVRGLVNSMSRLEMVPEPPGLTRKILDATIGPRVKVGFWERWTGWTAAQLRPRLAMGAVTMAAVAVIAFQVSGVKAARFRHVDLNPISYFHTANRQAHLVYSRSVRFVNDLRVVYEIESRLQPAPEASPIEPPALPEEQPAQPGTNPQQKSENDKHRDRSQIRTAALVAMLSPAEFFVGGSTRSFQ
ncbi:MAG TPA: zf-HC2 domain-containing protein [Candidatus Acidoferrum sp.]|nr:zf-HC2 domain-containing protein [Candidatus Acidoferrum sp.]